MIIVTPCLSNSFVLMFFVQTKTKTPAFSNSSGFKSVFEKLRFRDGLVWTVGLTAKIKLRFQLISPVRCSERCQKLGKIYATIDSWQKLFVTPTSPTFAFLAMN